MQKSSTAARSFSLIVLAFASSAFAQDNSHSSNSGARGPAIAIEKINKRPAAASTELSIKEYESLMAKSPRDPVVLNNLGAFYFLSGRIYEAQSLMRRDAQGAPDSSQIQINLAIVLNRVFNPALAITTLEGVMTKEPDYHRARSILCDLYGQEKRNSEAAGCYDRLLGLKKLDAISAANFGTVLLEIGEVDRALKVLQTADAEFPDDPGIKNGLGVAFFHKKKYAHSENYLVRAVELSPAAGQLRYNLALAQMMLKNKGAVLEQYKYLKAADPELAGQLYKHIFKDKLVFIDK